VSSLVAQFVDFVFKICNKQKNDYPDTDGNKEKQQLVAHIPLLPTLLMYQIHDKHSNHESAMKHILTSYYKTPYGELILGAYDDKLCLCDWRYRKSAAAIEQRLTKYLDAWFKQDSTDLHRETMLQLEQYFTMERKRFELPVLTAGTAFQERVWQELAKIPFGNTMNYRELAERTGNRNAVRAVAAANGANAISIVIPCHRVIGSNGTLVGYAGGLTAKKSLLKLENNLFNAV
jgi:methylated-DNA-[protein]-cysteine S-methyltransferase